MRNQLFEGVIEITDHNYRFSEKGTLVMHPNWQPCVSKFRDISKE